MVTKRMTKLNFSLLAPEKVFDYFKSIRAI
jgi:hypothetical protein